MNNPDTVIALLEGDGFNPLTRRALSMLIALPERKDYATAMIGIFCKSCTDASLPAPDAASLASVTHATIAAYPERYDLAIEGIKTTLGSMAHDDRRAPATIQGCCVGLMESFVNFEKSAGDKEVATFVVMYANLMAQIITGSLDQGTMSREFSGRMANAAARFVSSMAKRSRAIEPPGSPWKRLVPMFFSRLSEIASEPLKEGDVPALIWTIKELALRVYLSSPMAVRLEFAQTCPI